MNKLKNIFANLVLVVISLIFIFVLCEGILRLKNAIIPNYDIEMWKYAKALKKKSKNPKIGHIHVKNKSIKLQKTDIRINNLGQRGGDINLENLKNFDRKILFLGSSITLGWGVHEDKISTTVIDDLAKKNNKNWKVINGGIGNYNAQRYINNYLENWSNLKVTDIVIQFFVNDTEILKDGNVNFFTLHTHTGVMVWKFINSLKSDLKSENIESYYKKLYQDDFDGFNVTAKELKKLKSHCYEKQINCLLVLIPDIHKLNPYKLLFINNKMKSLANEIDFKIYDLLPDFEVVDSKKLWNKYNDPHPNELGHKIMGEKIYKILTQ
tara:strand:+ start:205 stop:1176 length:972 start_codon:yes stop_codon:yes gene_type:complete